jgi:hypothetical protein
MRPCSAVAACVALATMTFTTVGAQGIVVRRAADSVVAPMTPASRLAAAVAYDQARDRILVYGGLLAGRGPGVDPLDPDPRMYAWQQGQWSVVTETGPRSRDEMATAVDPHTGMLIMFGGRGLGAERDSRGFSVRVPFRDTWTFDGERWRLADTSGPDARSSPKGAFDSARNRFVLFGGAIGNAGPTAVLSTDTWEWDGQRWTRFDVPGPPGRTGHVMAYDANARVIIVHGGVRSADGVALTDTWAWNGKVWKLLTMEGPRSIFGAATTALDSGIVMFGGHMLRGSSAATWQWDGRSWRTIATEGPAPRTFNSLVTDVRRKRIYLLGGGPDEIWFLDAGSGWMKWSEGR